MGSVVQILHMDADDFNNALAVARREGVKDTEDLLKKNIILRPVNICTMMHYKDRRTAVKEMKKRGAKQDAIGWYITQYNWENNI